MKKSLLNMVWYVFVGNIILMLSLLLISAIITDREKRLKEKNDSRYELIMLDVNGNSSSRHIIDGWYYVEKNTGVFYYYDLCHGDSYCMFKGSYYVRKIK